MIEAFYFGFCVERIFGNVELFSLAHHNAERIIEHTPAEVTIRKAGYDFSFRVFAL